MVFDNKDILYKINKLRYILLLSFSTVLILIVFSGFFDKPVYGIEKAVYIAIVTFVYVSYNIIKYILNYNYFYYNDEGSKLIFRFVSMRPFNNKRNAIEINKKDFKAYKTNVSLFKLKEDLTLLIKTQRGIVNYPPISITALSEKQKKFLKNSLSQFVKA